MMELDTIEKIISMVGEATGDAATIAILWIAGGFLVALINSGIVAYIVMQIIKLVYKYSERSDRNKKFLDEALIEARQKDVDISNHQTELNNQVSTHNVELEKVKHLYKILKESKDVRG